MPTNKDYLDKFPQLLTAAWGYNRGDRHARAFA